MSHRTLMRSAHHRYASPSSPLAGCYARVLRKGCFAKTLTDQRVEWYHRLMTTATAQANPDLAFSKQLTAIAH